jgi:N-acetylglucosamine kinase-like BadF-type ATPase
MLLIADGGSTTAQWCLVSPEGNLTRFETEGYNPHFVDKDHIVSSLGQAIPAAMDSRRVLQVAFYGSGCMAGKDKVMESALCTVFPHAVVQVQGDLLAAARALLGKTRGFAAILGTGTNTCLYDGRNITRNIDSLGYMLGDEGSGSYIGKKLISDYLRGQMPEEMGAAFGAWIGLSFDDIFDRIYAQPLPNRFCAEATRFAGSHIGHPYARRIVKAAFKDFFSGLVCRYPGYDRYSFNCIGSVAYFFSDILSEVAEAYGMQTGKIIRHSLDELIRYHLDNPLL